MLKNWCIRNEEAVAQMSDPFDDLLSVARGQPRGKSGQSGSSSPVKAGTHAAAGSLPSSGPRPVSDPQPSFCTDLPQVQLVGATDRCGTLSRTSSLLS